jgi:flagellin-like protein
MKRLFQSKKAVSPVVATLLLVALTVSAGAIVYFVVIPLLNRGPEITFGINDISNYYDYDHDGTIDALRVNIIVVTTNGVGFANMSLFSYEIHAQTESYTWVHTTAGVTLISDGKSGDIVIASWSESGELLEGVSYTLRIWYESNEETLHFQAETPTLGSLVTVNVIDEDSDPVAGAEVDFYYANNAFTGKPTLVTTGTGQVQIALRVGEYKVRVRYLETNYWSEEFKHPPTNQITVIVGAGVDLMKVNVISDGGPVPGVRVYSFDSFDRFVGDYGTTNDDGEAFLIIDPGTYVFKVFYLGLNYSSPLVTFPDVNETTINIGGGTVYARVVDSDDVGQAGYRVYLFSSTGSYLGLSRRTNETGYAAFTLSSGAYKFRVDYGGARSWSSIFGASDGAVINIYIGGKVYAHVVYGSDETPLANVRVYMFTASGSYTGRSGRTNATGYVLFSPVQKETYFKFRVDYAGGREWSSEFTGDAASQVVTINIGAEVYAHVIYGDDNNYLANVRVYLFTATGSYTGLSARTNETGYAQFNGVLKSTNYKFRIDYAAARFWSEIFNGSISPLVVDINIGGTVYAHVVYGLSNEPLENVRVYLFTATGSYSGISRRTNATGYARFDGVISTTNFKFRVDYAAGRFWSTEFNGSIDGYVVDINIGGIVYAHVTYGPDNDPLYNVQVYLFTATGSYSGISARTNSSGYARFNGVLSNTNYKFRVDYLAARYWSTEFNGSLPEYTHEMNIGGIVYAHVIYGLDNDPLDNVRVYLFTASGSYSGLSVRTNATGHAQFNGLLRDTNFKFRINYLNGYFWSTEVNGSLPEYEFDINIGNRTYCYVHASGTPVTNTWVYLFIEGGTYTGLRVRTNATGYAEFNGTMSNYNYYFRVDYSGYKYSSIFNGGDGGVIVMDVDLLLIPSAMQPIKRIEILLPTKHEFALC